MAEGSGKSAKRSALKRGVLALAGSFGLGFGGGGAVTRAESGAPRGTTLTLFGRYWHLSAPHRVPGELPVRGDRMAMFGELLASQDGQKVGEFYAACFCVDSPFGSSPFAAANVEFHTFNLEDGTISGMGTASAGENVYA